MEIPAAALTRQRALAAGFVALAAAAAWMERGSAVAAHRRSGLALPAWVEVREGSGDSRPHLAVYHPVSRSLDLLHVPDERREGLPRGAASWEGAPRLALRARALDERDEPPLRAASALRAQLGSPRAWLALGRDAARGLARGERGAAEPLLLALELLAVSPERLRPAWLPAGEPEAAALLARLLSGDPPPAPSAGITAEVLNGAGVDGLASRAAKMLRLRGVDVVTTGDAGRARERTVAYDRVGEFSRAAAVLATLGCREASAVTRLDALRAVDVSVELGRDCARLGGAGADPH